MITEPLTTSLSNLDSHSWAIISNTWAKGIDWIVGKVGRKWEIYGRLGQGFPLFTTKRAAYDAATALVIAESHHRSWLLHREETTMTTDLSRTEHDDMVGALKDAARWLACAISQNAFEGCVSPKGGELALARIVMAIERAEKATDASRV